MAKIFPTLDTEELQENGELPTRREPRPCQIVDVLPVETASPKSKASLPEELDGDQETVEHYDPQQVPPNFNIAIKHAKAMKVTKLPDSVGGVSATIDPGSGNLCPCCNLPYDADPISLLAPTKQLSDLGIGFPLLFNFVKFLIIICCVCSLAAVYFLIDNYTAGKQEEWADHYHVLNIMNGTLAAHGKDGTPTDQLWINIGISVVLYGLYAITWISHQRQMKKIDDNSITPRTFTLLLSGLPGPFDQNELQTFLEENSLVSEEASIAKIIPVYAISKYIRYRKLHAKWRARYKLNLSADGKRTKLSCLQTPQQCLTQMKRVRDLMREEELNLKTKNYSGKALVTYMYAHEASQALSNLTRPAVNNKCELLWNLAFFHQAPKSQIQFKDARFRATQAPEPNDIMWENFGHEVPFGRKLLTGVAALTLLIISGVLVYYSLELEMGLEEPEDDLSMVLYQLLKLVPSTVVLIINELLIISIKYLTKQEKHDTTTEYATNVCVHITLALFINTGVVSLLNFGTNIYGHYGLIENIFIIITVNAVVSPITPLLNPKIFAKVIQRKIALKQGKNSKLTQQQANNLFQGVQIDISERKANFMKTFFLAMLYGPVMPILFPVTVVSLATEYWVVKFMLLRIYCRPLHLSYHIDQTMLNMLPFGFLLFCFGNFYFQIAFNDEAFWPGMSGMLIILALILFPWKAIYKMQEIIKESNRTINEGQKPEEQKCYEDYAVDFFEDYDRSNPITSELGYEQWISLIQRKNGNLMAKKIQALIDDEYEFDQPSKNNLQRRDSARTRQGSNEVNLEAQTYYKGFARFDQSAAMQERFNKFDIFRFRNRFVAKRQAKKATERRRYSRSVVTQPPIFVTRQIEERKNEEPAVPPENLFINRFNTLTIQRISDNFFDQQQKFEITRPTQTEEPVCLLIPKQHFEVKLKPQSFLVANPGIPPQGFETSSEECIDNHLPANRESQTDFVTTTLTGRFTLQSITSGESSVQGDNMNYS